MLGGALSGHRFKRPLVARKRLAAERGVLVTSAGVKGNCIRFLNPLVITDDALDVLESCVEEVYQGSRSAETGMQPTVAGSA